MEILAIISTVAPGVITIFGILGMILSAVSKFTKIITEFKQNKDALLEELRKSDSQYKAQVEMLIVQNKEFLKQNKKLTDAIARIKGYSDKTGG